MEGIRISGDLRLPAWRAEELQLAMAEALFQQGLLTQDQRRAVCRRLGGGHEESACERGGTLWESR